MYQGFQKGPQGDICSVTLQAQHVDCDPASTAQQTLLPSRKFSCLVVVTVSFLNFSVLTSERMRALPWEHRGKPEVNAKDPQTAQRSRGITPVPQPEDEPAEQVLSTESAREAG